MYINQFTLIDAFNQFWKVLQESGNRQSLLSAYQMYGYLCHLWNGQGRPASFRRQNNSICAEICLSKPTLDRHRQVLKNAGLIDFFSKGKGDTNITYQILEVKLFYFPEVKKLNNITSGVTTPVTSDECIKQSTEEELFINVEGEVKLFYYLKDLFEQDTGLLMHWKHQGFAAGEFSEGVKLWMIQNNGNKYHDFEKARKHFLFWIPSYELKLKKSKTNETGSRTFNSGEGAGNSGYAKGF